MPKRPIITRRDFFRPGRRQRIRIPQPADKPIRFQSGSAVRKEFIDQDPWWFVLHRRGVRRPEVGLDPLEARAVSENTVRGTLPERIMYKELQIRRLMGLFDFQSSLQGGRMELGGIVADFLSDFYRMVIRVQGPTHKGHRRFRKDEEQRNILEEMGYSVHDIDDQTLYDSAKTARWLDRVFARGTSFQFPTDVGTYGNEEANIPTSNLVEIAQGIDGLSQALSGLVS